MNIVDTRAAAHDGIYVMWHRPDGAPLGPFRIALVTKAGMAIPELFPELRIRPRELVPCARSEHWAQMLRARGLPHDARLIGDP